jgi:uncharacterized protein (TIGR00369 family)
MNGQLPKARATFLAQDFRRGFIEYCQYEADEIERGYFRSRVAIKEQHRQQDGFVHAGVLATMADHTAGYSAYTIVPEELRILTIEFKVNFLNPATGDELVCCSRVIKEGSQIIVSESEVFDVREGEETLAAKAIVTLMALHRDKVAPRS